MPSDRGPHPEDADQFGAPQLHARQSSRKVAGREVHIDAFDVLIPPEAALERAYLFGGRDAAYRDSTCVPQSLISL